MRTLRSCNSIRTIWPKYSLRTRPELEPFQSEHPNDKCRPKIYALSIARECAKVYKMYIPLVGHASTGERGHKCTRMRSKFIVRQDRPYPCCRERGKNPDKVMPRHNPLSTEILPYLYLLGF
jgi:hypothetical protein